MSAWQPIEKAPKDGAYVLCWMPYNDSPVVAQFICDRWQLNAENVEVSCGMWCEGGSIITQHDFKPTHWQPLPEPPTPEATRG